MTARDDAPVPQYRSLGRNRDFQLLWSGQAISVLGSQTSKIAYPLLVLAMTTGARVHDRAGGLKASEIKGLDGLR